MKNIKQLRESKGMSQKELALILNTSQQAIYKYENGQATPSISTLMDMSEIFNTTVDYLIAKDDSETNAPFLANVRLSRDEYELIAHYRMLRPKSKKLLRNVVSCIQN